jgi:hypothetical protein
MDISFQKRYFKCLSLPKDNFNDFEIGNKYMMESNIIGDPFLYDTSQNYICSISRVELHTHFIEEQKSEINVCKQVKYGCLYTFEIKSNLSISFRKNFTKGQEFLVNTNHKRSMFFLYKTPNDYYTCLNSEDFIKNFAKIDENYYYYIELDKKFEEIINE